MTFDRVRNWLAERWKAAMPLVVGVAYALADAIGTGAQLTRETTVALVVAAVATYVKRNLPPIVE